jgi:Rrf2 family transcriptional regulator, iron-sulfur cluster assembly transcription factor
MIFSKPTGYAIRALVFLAENQGETPILNSIIAKEENIPTSFLSRIMADLVEAQIVQSVRGRNGGYSLARDPDSIKLINIINTYEHHEIFESCLIGFGSCVCNVKCDFHLRWARVQVQIDEYLETTTIGDMIRDRQLMRKAKMVHA